MNSGVFSREDLQNLSICSLGEPKIDSTLKVDEGIYVDEDYRVSVYAEVQKMNEYVQRQEAIPSFECAGPRKKIFFDPSDLVCGIVTCGGLCPGLNNVVRTISLTLLWQYGAKKVLGFQHGYEGLSSKSKTEPLDLIPSVIEDIQHKGGTILGSSRGPQDPGDLVDTLIKKNVKILFTVGGDGTLAGAHCIAQEIQKRHLSIAVIGVPKTIDNDIYCSEMSFGFTTAVEKAQESIAAAHEEARSALNGIGLVKLMGRDSGFIATSATLANSDVTMCLIPEHKFCLEGEDGLLQQLENRLERKRHAVIVVAEGAAQELMAQPQESQKDASGNVRYEDVGLFLKQAIIEYFKKKDIPISLKYIDPSYTIRSCPANAYDSILCLLLGQNAVHAGMAGKTDMFVSLWNQHFTHIPLTAAINKRKKVKLNGVLWQTVRAITD